jgi:hypothetical protein
VIATVRRKCLDWLIQLSESHLRFIRGVLSPGVMRRIHPFDDRHIFSHQRYNMDAMPARRDFTRRR